jgi:hypothetical protein
MSDQHQQQTLNRLSILTPLLVDLGEVAVAVAVVGVISLNILQTESRINFLPLILRQHIIMGEITLILSRLSDIKEATDTTPIGLILLVVIMTRINILNILKQPLRLIVTLLLLLTITHPWQDSNRHGIISLSSSSALLLIIILWTLIRPLQRHL